MMEFIFLKKLHLRYLTGFSHLYCKTFFLLKIIFDKSVFFILDCLIFYMKFFIPFNYGQETYNCLSFFKVKCSIMSFIK